MTLRQLTVAVGLIATVTAAPAADLSIWALQADLRTAAGDPNVALAPAALAHNPANGQLFIACGGSNGTILEWPRGSSTGTVLVTRANWGGASAPQPYASAYVASRGTYLLACGGDDNVIFEIVPAQANQVPAAYVTPVSPTWPAGGLVTDGPYGYYKNQWTGIQQTVNRFLLSGTTAVDEEYVPPSAFDAWDLAGPSLQLAMNTANELYLSGRPKTGAPNTVRGVYRWDTATAALVPVLTFAQITAYTGQSNVGLYGMTFDTEDNLYFYDIYAAGILRRDRTGNLSTFLTNAEVCDFMADPNMQVHPSYLHVVNDQLVFVSGNVSGHVLAAQLPAIEPELVTVPGTDYEINGPTYTYRLGRYEITNAQYCIFLNDVELARQTDPNDPRCANTWIDPANGDVYMMNVTIFPPGSEWYDRTLYKTSDIPDSKLKYNAALAPGSRFYVLDGFDLHPVGTVSWFGAAKYCNWLTIHNGLGPAQRCYHEGPSKNDWYALTASDWTNNGLLPAERFDLVRNYRGYRLPMDGVNVDNGGPGVAHSWNIDANPYNEWYKAAAFDPNAPATVRAGPGDAEVVQPYHWIFGFGSDVYTGADGNTLLSDHPFLETTPVGWYDGVHTLNDNTPTNDTRNRYGLYDMCGNTSEWINDTALESPWSSTYRGTRGGRFSNDDPMWVTNSVRVITTARYYAENSVGFRVLRSPGYGDFDGDDERNFADFAFFELACGAPDVPPVVGSGYEACDADGDLDVDLADFGHFQRGFAGPP